MKMTNIRKEAKQFVRLFRQQVEQAPVNKKKLLKLFKKTVENLSNNAVKEELTGHPTFYINYLKSLAQEKAKTSESNVEKTGTERKRKEKKRKGKKRLQKDVLAFNLYREPRCISIYKKAKPDYQEKLFNCLVHQQIKNLSHEEVLQLLENIKKNEKNPAVWLKRMQSLCTLSIGRLGEPENLHKIMAVFHSKVVENTSDIFSCGRKRIIGLQSSFYQFLLFCHTVSQGLKDTDTVLQPSYEEYMSSFLSVYIDMEIWCYQKETDESLLLKGKRIASRVTQLLDRWPNYLLEVILQLTNHLIQCAKYLLQPLLRKALLQYPRKGCFKEYTKYVCCVRHMKACMLNDLHQKIEEFVMAVPAPKNYLKWLRRQNPSLLDEFPETKHFKGVQITHFLHKEASDELLESLLQLLVTEDVGHPEEIPEETAKSSDQGAEPQTEPQTEQLYFFDKTASADIRDTVELTFEDNNEDDDAESGSLDGEGDGAETEIDNGEEKSEIDISDNDDLVEDHPEDILANTASALDEVVQSKEEEDAQRNHSSENMEQNEIESKIIAQNESATKEENKSVTQKDDQKEDNATPGDGSVSESSDGKKQSNEGLSDIEKLSQTPEKGRKNAVDRSPVKPASPKKTVSPKKQRLSSSAKKLSSSASPKKQTSATESKADSEDDGSRLISPIGKRLRPRKSFINSSPFKPSMAQSPARRTPSVSSERSDKGPVSSDNDDLVEDHPEDILANTASALDEVVQSKEEEDAQRNHSSENMEQNESESKIIAENESATKEENKSVTQKDDQKEDNATPGDGSVSESSDGKKQSNEGLSDIEKLSQTPEKGRKNAVDRSPVKPASPKKTVSPKKQRLSSSAKKLSSSASPKKQTSRRTPSVSSERSDKGPVSSEKDTAQSKQLNQNATKPAIVPNGTPQPPPTKRTSSPTKVSPGSPKRRSLSPSKRTSVKSPAESSNVTSTSKSHSDRRKSSESEALPTEAVTPKKSEGVVAQLLSPVRLTREHIKKKLAVVLGDVMEENSSSDNAQAQEIQAKLNLTPTRSRRRTISSMSKETYTVPSTKPETPIKRYQNDILDIISSPASHSKQTKAKNDRRRSMPAKITPLSPSKFRQDTPVKKAVVKISRIEELKSDCLGSPSAETTDEEGSPGLRRSKRIRRLSLQSINEEPATPKKAKNLPSTPSRAMDAS